MKLDLIFLSFIIAKIHVYKYLEVVNMNRKILITCIVVVVINLILSGPVEYTLAAGVEVGDIVDNFTLPDFDGNTHNLFDYEGHVIFINFWAVI